MGQTISSSIIKDYCCYFRLIGKSSGPTIGPVGSRSGNTNSSMSQFSQLAGANNNSASSVGGCNRCTSEACVNRIHELESRVKSLNRELKDAQMLNSNILKQHQSQQKHHQASEQVADLLMHLNELESENALLKSKLKTEEKMKQELLAGYHNSLKEITELNGKPHFLCFHHQSVAPLQDMQGRIILRGSRNCIV